MGECGRLLRVLRRGHNKPSEAEILHFPQDTHRMQPIEPTLEGPSTLTGTVWVSIVTRCTLITVLSSVVGETDTLAIRTANAVGHTSAVTDAACRLKDSAY